MRKIEDLLKNGNRVWLVLTSKKDKKNFAKEIKALNLHYLDGSKIKWKNCSTIMAVGGDKGVAHVSGLVWWHSKNSQPEQFKDVIRIDYEKYHHGNINYLL